MYMKYWEKYISQHLNNSSFSFNRSNREKNGFCFIGGSGKKTSKKGKCFFMIKLKTIFCFIVS